MILDQVANDIDGNRVIVVQEDKVATAERVPCEPRICLLGRSTTGILGVAVPQDNSLACLPESPELCWSQHPERRTKETRHISRQVGKEGPSFVDFVEELGRARGYRLGVGIGVVSQEMTFIANSAHQVRMAGRFSADHKEAGFGAESAELVEQARRVHGMGPVVKCQTRSSTGSRTVHQKKPAGQ